MVTSGADGSEPIVVAHALLDTLIEDPERWREFLELFWDNCRHLAGMDRSVYISQPDKLGMETAQMVVAIGAMYDEIMIDSSSPLKAVGALIDSMRYVCVNDPLCASLAAQRAIMKVRLVDGKPMVVDGDSFCFDIDVNNRQIATAMLHAMRNWSLREGRHPYGDREETYFLAHQSA